MVNASDQELSDGLHVSGKTGVPALFDGLHRLPEIEKFKTNPPGQENLNGDRALLIR